MNVAKVIGGSAKFVPAKKDSRLLYAPTGPYERRINIARTMDVIIYDVTSRRGWLVGGDDALLFMSRAALSHPDGERCSPDDQGLEPKDLFEHMHSPALELASSADVLLHKKNRDIVIYGNRLDASGVWRYEDLVNSQFEVLQEMRSHRAESKPCETQQYEFRKFWTKSFVGIGCLDIVSGKTNLRPRFRELCSSAAQWLRLASAIDSINIIGAGIDDLIAPSFRHQNAHLRPPWGSDVLTAPISRLQRIAREFGYEKHSDCVELARDIFWDDPKGVFRHELCPCDKQKPQSCCGRGIVELCERRRKSLKNMRSTGAPFVHVINKYPTAAICFGSRSLISQSGPTSTSLFQRLTRTIPGQQSSSTSARISSIFTLPPTPESTSPVSLRAIESRNSNAEEQIEEGPAMDRLELNSDVSSDRAASDDVL